MAKKRRHKRSTGSLISGHLGGIRRALLEGEARAATENGRTVHVRVLDIPLDLDPPREAS